jgi:hypothetical protein
MCLHTYFQADKKTLVFEQAWLEVVQEFISSGSVPSSAKLYYNAERSFIDLMNDSIDDDLNVLLAGYVLVLIYVVLALGRRNLLEMRVRIANLDIGKVTGYAF